MLLAIFILWFLIRAVQLAALIAWRSVIVAGWTLVAILQIIRWCWWVYRRHRGRRARHGEHGKPRP